MGEALSDHRGAMTEWVEKERARLRDAMVQVAADCQLAVLFAMAAATGLCQKQMHNWQITEFQRVQSRACDNTVTFCDFLKGEPQPQPEEDKTTMEVLHRITGKIVVEACLEVSRVTVEFGKLVVRSEEVKTMETSERRSWQWQARRERKELRTRLVKAAGMMHGCCECLLRSAGVRCRIPLQRSWLPEHNHFFLRKLKEWECPQCGHAKVERCLWS